MLSREVKVCFVAIGLPPQDTGVATLLRLAAGVNFAMLCPTAPRRMLDNAQRPARPTSIHERVFEGTSTILWYFSTQIQRCPCYKAEPLSTSYDIVSFGDAIKRPISPFLRISNMNRSDA